MKIGVYTFQEGKEPKDLKNEIKKLKKQLEIAKETLKKYAISDNYNLKNQCYPTVTNIDAIDAILKIKELEK